MANEAKRKLAADAAVNRAKAEEAKRASGKQAKAEEEKRADAAVRRIAAAQEKSEKLPRIQKPWSLRFLLGCFILSLIAFVVSYVLQAQIQALMWPWDFLLTGHCLGIVLVLSCISLGNLKVAEACNG